MLGRVDCWCQFKLFEYTRYIECTHQLSSVWIVLQHLRSNLAAGKTTPFFDFTIGPMECVIDISQSEESAVFYNQRSCRCTVAVEGRGKSLRIPSLLKPMVPKHNLGTKIKPVTKQTIAIKNMSLHDALVESGPLICLLKHS